MVVLHYSIHLSSHSPTNSLFAQGSTTAALITLLNTITTLLTTGLYIIVISLDFRRAFDTVQHSTPLEKLAPLDIPGNAFNWLVDFFGNHSHGTVYKGEWSTMKLVTASIIQGSAIGPASYFATAGDLNAVTPENRLVNFAADTYLVILASNVDSRTAEIRNAETWACQSNLILNSVTTKEIVLRRSTSKTSNATIAAVV